MDPIVSLLLILAVGAVTIAGLFVPSALRRARHRRLGQLPFPAEWRAFLEDHLPPYGHLSAESRQELHELISIFLGEKNFEGCGGLTLTDEIRVTVAAQACLLLLNRPTNIYPGWTPFSSIPRPTPIGRGET